MAEMKTLNGYEVVDAKARQDIKNLGDTTQQRLAEIETAIPSLDGYATETYVNEQIEAIPEPDLSHYALKSELPVVPTKVSAFENDAGYLTAVPDEYITETELEAKGYLTAHQDISGKADVGHQHTISDITDYSEPDLSGYATETYVDEAIANIDIPEAKREVYYFDPSQLDFGEESWATPPEELNEFASRVYSGDLVSLYIKHNTGWVPALYAYDSDSAKKTIHIYRNLLAGDVTGDDEFEILQYKYSIDSDGPYITDSPYLHSTVASKDYVDTAIAALEARIAALEALHATE